MKTKNLCKVLFAVMILSVLTFSVMTMSACSKKPSAVSQTTITYDGSLFKWDAAKNATSYKLIVNGQEKTTNETKYSYPASKNSSTTEIEIYAVNGKNVSEKTNKTFTKLETIDKNDITFTPEGVMSWPAVESASRYAISLNGNEVVIDATEFSEFIYGATNVIKIKPIGYDNSFYSFYSDPVTKTYLTTPNNISYDGQFLTWRGDNKSSNYIIYIDGIETGESTRSSYEYDAHESSFNVSVKAIGDGVSYFNSQMSDEANFKYLGTVENLQIVEGKLTWDEIEAANSYEVDINGTKQTVKTNSINVTSGSEQNVKIKPLSSEGTVYYSAYSNNFKFFIMNAPVLRWNSNLQLDGDPANAVYWDPVVGNVRDYRVKVVTPDGRTETYPTGNIPSFEESYIATGRYTISVQTVASAEGYYDSVWSTELIVNRLPAPTVALNGVTSNEKDIASGFTVKYTSVLGATQYKLYKDGTSTNQFSTTTSMDVHQIIDANVKAQQEISYSIQSIGSIKNQGNQIIVTLDSLSSGSESNPSRFNISVLAMPENIEIDGDIMSWNPIEGAPGYVVDLGTRTGIYTYEYNLSSITREGNYDVMICSMGDGARVLPSNYSPAIKIQKLPAPTNISIGTSVNEGVLSWDPVVNAKSFDVYFNGSSDPVNSADLDNVNQYIKVNTVSLTMKSVANYWNTDHSLYYVSSNLSNTKQFTKISKVVFANPTFTNTELIWNIPSNINANNSVSYTIFDEATNQVVARGLNATRYSLTELPAGPHTFTVKCIGDGLSLINSEKSDPVSITKLATPEVSRNSTGYTWNSVAGASSYVVYVEGKKAYTRDHISGFTYEFNPSFDQIKTYSVQVIAVGDGGLTTIDSAPCEIEQKVLQIGTPDFEISYDSDCFSTSGHIVITITSQPINATGYKYMVDGVVFNENKTNALTEYFTTTTVGEKVVSVMAYGGCFDSNGTYYIDSQVAGGNDNYKMTLLSKPNISSVEISNDGIMQWANVKGCKGYIVKIYYNDGTETVVDENVPQAYYIVNNSTNISKIEIQAKGNGINLISSEKITVYR